MKYIKLLITLFFITRTTQLQCMIMDPTVTKLVTTITNILDNPSKLGPPIQSIAIGTLGFFGAYNGLNLMNKGTYKAIENDSKKFNTTNYQNTWWTPERQKGILMCTFGLAFLTTGGYTILKPNRILKYFCP